jgi:hypothetical protein
MLSLRCIQGSTGESSVTVILTLLIFGYSRQNVLNIRIEGALFVRQTISRQPRDVNDDFLARDGGGGRREELADGLDKDSCIRVRAGCEVDEPGCATQVIKRLAKDLTELAIDNDRARICV